MSSAWDAFEKEEEEKLASLEAEKNKQLAEEKKKEDEYNALFAGKTELQIAKIKAQMATERKAKEDADRKEREETAKRRKKKNQEDLFARMERQRVEAEKAAKELEDATKRYKDGSRYVGEFKGDGTRLPHGYGELIRADGSIQYDGMWMEGLMHGTGKYTWTNDDCFEGTFKNDFPHGLGTVRFAGKEKKTREAIYKRGKRVCWLDELQDARIDIASGPCRVETGVVTEFRRDKMQHFIKYDMKDGRWVDLTLLDFKIRREAGKFKLVLSRDDG